MISKMLQALGGRKFIIIMILLGIGAAIDLLTARGLSENFQQLMIYLAAIYTTGNGIVSVSETMKMRAKVAAKASNLSGDVDKTIKDVLQYQDAILKTVQLNTQGLSELLNKQKPKQG